MIYLAKLRKWQRAYVKQYRNKSTVGLNTSDIGPTLIFRCEYDRVGKQEATKSRVIFDQMRHLYDATKDYLKRQIDLIVPYNTGALRENIKEALNLETYARARGYGIKSFEEFPTVEMYVGVRDIPYAREVNQMITQGGKPHLRHPPYFPSYTPLHADPGAESHFYEMLVRRGMLEARRLFRIMINILERTYPGISSQFSMTTGTSVGIV